MSILIRAICPPLPLLILLIGTSAFSQKVTAQTPLPVPVPPVPQTLPQAVPQTTPQVPPQTPTPLPPSTTPAPSQNGAATPTSPTDLNANQVNFSSEGEFRIDQTTGDLYATDNVTVQFGDLVITADKAEGNFYREVVFSGNAKIVRGGLTSSADAIHFFAKTRTYRLDNPRTVLAPSVLRYKLTDPVFLRGKVLQGARNGYSYAENSRATTCIEDKPHYELRFRSAELIPDYRLTLKRVAIYFFGQKLIVLPEIVIPLDRRVDRYQPSYLPEFGRSIQEGFFARFPFSFAVGAAAAALIRLDVTEKQGPGYRFEQEYLAGKQDRIFGNNTPEQVRFNYTGNNGTYLQSYGYGGNVRGLPRLGTGLGPSNGGLFTIQGYASDGFQKNLNTSFRHQQSIGGSNRIAFSTEYQKNNLYTFSNQTNLNSRFDFDHSDGVHGARINASVATNQSDAIGFNSRQYTATLRPAFDWASLGSNRNSLSFDFNFAKSRNSSAFSDSSTSTLNSQVQFQHLSRDYSFNAQANKLSPIGSQTTTSSFGNLERLPELQFASDTFNFKRGWFRKVPAHLDFGYGYYSEPGAGTQTSRYLVGMTLQEQTLLRGKSTEVATGGGFEQRVYGDTSAQYILRNTTRLRQRFGGRSGMDITYQYQEPAGGTPFLFDTFGRSHYITAEAGYLNDERFQVTGRVGYDFLGMSSVRPWQTVSARLLWRPSRLSRLDVLSTYDPNSAKFYSVSSILRLRGKNDFAFDLQGRYDAQVGRVAQVNSQIDLPFLGKWRATGLLRYNGYSGKLESTNVQVAYRWDCMEASLTYTATPY
ncbi:MAG: hypothetical protein H7308_01890, partial [Chthonomonadaceae bacterium]|nr:hypothetical protein [Chthonomonadaceae bacterium]